MSKSKWWIVLSIPFVAALGAGLYLWSGTRAVPIAEAVRSGAVQVSVAGVNIENLQFTFTATAGGPAQIVIPAGTLLASNDAGTQNMMTARAITVVLQSDPGSPAPQTVTVPVYCINHHLAAPTPVSAFTLGTITEETEPVQRLAQCLEHLSAEHRHKQFAIWSVSDKYVDMDETAFVEDAYDRWQADIHKLGPDGVADKIQRELKDVPPEQVALIRSLSPAELDEILTPLRPQLVQGKREQFKQMRTTAKPLLEQCGYATDTLRMFAGI